MITSIFLTAILFTGQCRIVWTDPSGKNHTGKWMPCKSAAVWAEKGNRDFPHLKHRVEQRKRKK